MEGSPSHIRAIFFCGARWTTCEAFRARQGYYWALSAFVGTERRDGFRDANRRYRVEKVAALERAMWGRRRMSRSSDEIGIRARQRCVVGPSVLPVVLGLDIVHSFLIDASEMRAPCSSRVGVFTRPGAPRSRSSPSTHPLGTDGSPRHRAPTWLLTEKGGRISSYLDVTSTPRPRSMARRCLVEATGSFDLLEPHEMPQSPLTCRP